LTPTSSKTISVLQTFQPPNLSFPCQGFLLDVQPNLNLEFTLDSFKSTFIWSSHLLVSGFSCIVFEHLQNLFDLEDSTNAFPQLFQVCSHVVMNHIPMPIVWVFGATKLLALAKSFEGIHLIVVGEVLYQLVNKTLFLQFCDTFFIHLLFHHFSMANKGRCEAVVHGIWIILNIHPNWVVLHANVVKCLQHHLRESHLLELCTIRGQLFQLSPFVWSFYAYKVFFLKICHFFQGFISHPLLGGHMPGQSTCWTFFALAHFHALWCSTKVFPSCIPSLVDDTHIIGLTSTVHLTFYHFVFHLAFMRLVI
jgi:hypothetical protein